MKTLFEIYRILRELGIKTKDIIGVGGKIKQVGKTLANANVNTQVLRLINRTGEIGESLKNELVNVGRSLRNLNDLEKRKFLTNIKRIKDVFSPAEAEVIDIATRAKLPAAGIEKLKTNVGFPRNIHPESDIGRIMTHARKGKTFDTTKEAMQLGSARWIMNRAVKEDAFAFKPEEIEIIKGGKGNVLEIFKKYYGNKAANKLPTEGSITAASKFADELKWAVDENGLLAKHPDFNKEAINWKLTRELVKDYSKKLDDHPFETFTQLKAEMPLAEVKVEGPFPRLDPDNDAFIILDAKGNKAGRYEGSVTADEVTGRSVTKWWDKWDVENNKLFTDKSKYKFSGAMDDKGNDIITPEGVIEGGKTPPEDLASGGRIGMRSGTKIIDLVVKHGPAFKKFADGLFIKASNAIRRGQGIFKNLTQSQRITQHDNLVKTIKTFEKEGTLEGAEQYFGINAEKAFIEAQAKVKPQGKIWKDIKGETQGIAMGFNKEEMKGLDIAMQKGMALSDAMKQLKLNPASSKETLKFDQLVSEGMIGFSKELRTQILKAKYGDILPADLLNNMTATTDPQKLATVMGTVDEALIMQEKGMGAEAIIKTMMDSMKRRPQASGGSVPGFATGGVSNLFRRR